MWDYNKKVMEYFLHPVNAGEIENPDGVGEEGSLACGDMLKLTFKLGKDGRIADVKFKTFGCASAIASSSVMTEMVKGLTLEEASKITNKDIVDKLGGLPEQKMHCSVMGMEALQAAIANYHKSKGKGVQTKKIEGKIVCTCFGVTDKEIEKVITENNLDSVEQVTNYCKAGGGCGSCRGEIQMIIDKIRGKKEKGAETQAKPKKLTNLQKIQLIQRTISEQIRPLLKTDGGDIDLIDIEGSKVIVAFRGMCSKCPTAEFTLKDVVEARLREFVSNDIVVEEQSE